MKLLIFLLATFILFLTFKPGIDLFSLQEDTEQTCCGGQCYPTDFNDNSHEQNTNNDCDAKSCNPFQVCNSCFLVCLNIPLDSIPILTDYSDIGFIDQTTFTFQFATDYWQPPKIV